MSATALSAPLLPTYARQDVTFVAGEKSELTANQWSPLTVGRLSTAVGVAEATLDAAKAHTAVQHSRCVPS